MTAITSMKATTTKPHGEDGVIQRAPKARRISSLFRLFEFRRLLLICLMGFMGLLLSGALNAQSAKVVAHDAWVREPLKSKTETALFLTIENHTGQPRAIVSVSSDASSSAEMHQMHMEKMVMVMLPVTQIGIPANGKTTLDPNGFHIMLFGLKNRPAVGDKINVTLKLDDGTTVPVEATVRK